MYMMLCAIWYYLCDLNNVKNTHGGVLLTVTLLHGCFSRCLNRTDSTKSRIASHCTNCTNGTKSRKASHILQDLTQILATNISEVTRFNSTI